MIKYDPSDKRKLKDIEVKHDTWVAACAYAESMRHAGYRIVRRGLTVIIKGNEDD